MITFSIERTSLALSALVLSDDPSGSYIITEDGFPRVSFEWRRSYGPESRHFRREIIAAVLEAVEIPFEVLVVGTSAADLQSKVNVLDAALGQFVYDATITRDGVSTTYECEVCSPSWEQDSGMTRAHLAKATFTLPINPPGA